MSLKKDFTENGYIAKKGFLNETELNDLLINTDRFITEVIPTIPEEQVYYEDKNDLATLKQIQLMHKYDDYFTELANSEKVVSLAEELLGGAVNLVNMQYFNKFPGKNVGTPAHQDGFYFPIKPQEALTMWLSLGYADEENGAVQYIPKSHKKGMRAHGQSSILGFSQTISDWTEEDRQSLVQMEAAPGDILVHHSLTVHAAKANRSNRNRRSVGFIFYRADVELDAEAHAAYQATLASQLENEGKI